MNEPPPPRRWFRFRLRTLLIAITLIAIVLGWHQYQSRTRRLAVSAILASGGKVEYEYELMRRLAPQGNWVLPRLLYTLDLVDPQSVVLRGNSVDDRFVQLHVVPLMSLEQISFEYVAVTNDGLKQLQALSELQMLSCFRDPRNIDVSTVLTETMTVEFIDVPVTDALNYLTDLHKVHFSYDQPELDRMEAKAEPLTTATINNKPLAETLDLLLLPHGLGWLIAGGGILVTSADKARTGRAIVEELKAALPKLKYVTIDYEPTPQP